MTGYVEEVLSATDTVIITGDIVMEEMEVGYMSRSPLWNRFSAAIAFTKGMDGRGGCHVLETTFHPAHAASGVNCCHTNRCPLRQMDGSWIPPWSIRTGSLLLVFHVYETEYKFCADGWFCAGGCG